MRVGRQPTVMSATPTPPPPPPIPTVSPRPSGGHGPGAGAIVAIVAAVLVAVSGLLAWVLLRDDDGETVTETAPTTTVVEPTTVPTPPVVDVDVDDAADGRLVAVEDLEPAMCFDPGYVSDEATEVEPSMWVVDCSTPHEAEVITTFDSELDDAVYPQAELERETEERCAEDLEALDLDDQPNAVQAFYIYPSPDTWAAGDREVICVAQGDGGLEGSVLASGEVVPILALEPGMCFDLGRVGEERQLAEGPTVLVVDCATAHDTEVVSVLRTVFEEWDPMIGDEADDRCAVEIGGLDLAAQPADVRHRFYFPSSDTFAAGDRRITCLVNSEQGLDGAVTD